MLLRRAVETFSCSFSGFLSYCNWCPILQHFLRIWGQLPYPVGVEISRTTTCMAMPS